MGTRIMSIQEGLNELKTLDARINRLLTGSKSYGAITIGERTVQGFDSNEKFIESAKAAFQSVQALIKRRTHIKNAIIAKNAQVIVEIAGVEMSLAEAINHKNYIKADKELYKTLVNQYNQLMCLLDSSESQYRQKLDAHVENIVGKDQKEKMKANEEIIKFFKEQNEPHFHDPIGLKDTIEKMAQEIEDFEAKVDFVLTRANITNDIEFIDPTIE